jgi:hypothetical protein
MLYKIAQFESYGRLLNRSGGSSQADGWLLKYVHFRSGASGIELWMVVGGSKTQFTLGLYPLMKM